jgi:glycosyltransferase involved in cell wall biosynthesis
MSADRLHIAHLIETDGPGGAERIVADIAATLQQRSASENVVFVPRAGEGWIAAQLQGSGVAIEHFDVDRPLSRSCARELAAAFVRHRIDVAHSHEFSMAVYGALTAWRAGVPHVITMHGGRYYAGRLRRRLALRAAIVSSGRTVAVSAELRSALTRDLHLSHTRVRLVYNGVRHIPPPAVTLRNELRLGPRDRLIVAVGNLYPVKGHQHLIDALALLTTRHPAAHVAISGRGGLADDLMARARGLGVDSRLHLLGLRSDVSAILAAADVFVLPSLAEGLPLALLEAMFAGCPIVASRVGEIPRVLQDGAAGLLVAPGHAADLANAIDSLLANPLRANALGTCARHVAQSTYDVSRMVDRYFRTYRALVRINREDGAIRTLPSLHADSPLPQQ